MSNKRRNPFKMRASEKIESDANFLRLFSPEALDLLLDRHIKEELWDKVVFIRSSPGSGKTSLLRVFEPGSLNLVFNQRSQDHKELFGVLNKLEVLNNERVEIIGVSVKCNRNYEILEDLDVKEIKKIRLFYSLLNARIILATLRAIVDFKQQELGETGGLNDISFEYNNEHRFLKSLQTPCNGQELFDWASNIERLVYEALDSFLPLEDSAIEGHDELYSLEILKPEFFTINNNPVCSRFLFMLDDAHKLSIKQRDSLFSYVTERRASFSLWISERIETELYNSNFSSKNFASFLDRDYYEINLEKFWGDHAAKFKKVLARIATKRADLSTEDVSAFQEYLDGDLNEVTYKEQIQTSIDNTLDKINKITAYSPKFDNWIVFLSERSIISMERALVVKQAEILVERSMGKKQLSFEFPLIQEELEEKMDSALKNAAHLFLCKEYNLPYYYGFQDLVSISSNNIEQFLGFAANLFEGMLSNKIMGINVLLNPERQEGLIKEVVKKKWVELPTLLPESNFVMSLLEGLGKYFQNITYKPSASYAPGVSGFSIKTANNRLLMDEFDWEKNELYYPLRDAINICLAFNLLEVREVAQGQKGTTWKVFYLNRWLCVRYTLPLTYGGWNKLTPDQLLKWTIKK